MRYSSSSRLLSVALAFATVVMASSEPGETMCRSKSSWYETRVGFCAKYLTSSGKSLDYCDEEYSGSFDVVYWAENECFNDVPIKMQNNTVKTAYSFWWMFDNVNRSFVPFTMQEVETYYQDWLHVPICDEHGLTTKSLIYYMFAAWVLLDTNIASSSEGYTSQIGGNVQVANGLFDTHDFMESNILEFEEFEGANIDWDFYHNAWLTLVDLVGTNGTDGVLISPGKQYPAYYVHCHNLIFNTSTEEKKNFLLNGDLDKSVKWAPKAITYKNLTNAESRLREVRTNNPDVDMLIKSDHNIKITNGLDYKINCRLSKFGAHLTVVVAKESSETIMIPDPYYERNGDMEVTCRKSDDTVVDHQVFYIYAEKTVVVHDCVYCKLLFQDFAALDLGLQALLVAAWLILIVLVVSFRKTIIEFLKIVWLMLKTLVEMILEFSRWLAMYLYRISGAKKFVDNYKDKMRRGAMNDIPMETVEKQDGGISRGFRPKFTFFLIGLAIAALADCNVNAVTTGQVVNCVGTASKNCTASFTSTITFSQLGQEACIEIGDNVSETLIGRFRVVFVDYVLTGSLARSYYSSKWEAKHESVIACNGESWCEDDVGETDSCIDMKQTSVTPFKKVASRYPGKTECKREDVSDSITCSIVHALTDLNGCQAVRGYIKPTSHIVEVYDITEITEQPLFSVYRGDTFLGNITWNTLTTNGLSFELQDAVDSVTQEYLSKRSVIVWDDKAALDIVSNANQPKRGALGDIQSKSRTGLTTPTKNSFIFDPDILSLDFDDDGNGKVEYSRSGFSAWLSDYKDKLLPKIIADVKWDYNSTDTALIGYQSGGVSASITVDGHDVALVYSVPETCPTITLREDKAHGCYNCVEGAVAKITVKDSCSGGEVHLTADTVTLAQDFANSTRDGADYNLHFMAEKATGCFMLTATGTNKASSTKICWECINKADLYNKGDDLTQPVANKYKDGIFGGAFAGDGWDWPNMAGAFTTPDSWKWYDWIIVVAVALVLMFGLAVCAFVAIKLSFAVAKSAKVA